MPTGKDKRLITPTLYSAIRQVIKQEFLELNTAMPGQISSFNLDTQLAVIKPSLKIKYKDESESKDRPLISNVPVVFPKMGNAHIRFPIEPGQEGLIIWSQRSIDKWISLGGIVDPEDNRKFDYSDAFFIIGAVSQPNKIINKGKTTSLEIVNDKMVIELQSSGKLKINNESVELLEQLVNLVDKLINAKVLTMLGPQPFLATTITELTLIKNEIEKLKGD